MPQIKEYNQQTAGVGVVNPTLISGTDISGGMGRNLQSLAGDADKIIAFQAENERKQQDFEAEKIKMKEQLDLNDYMQQLKMKAPAGADGFTDEAKKELDKRKQDILNSASSDYMRQKLDVDLNRVHYSALNDAMQFEIESKAKKDKLDVQEIQYRSKNAVRQNPATVTAAIESMNKLIDSTRLDSAAKMQWKAQELQDLRQNEIRGWIDINPYRAKEMIDSGTWNNDLSDDLRNSLSHEATQGIRAAEIEKNRSKQLADDETEAKREAIKSSFIEKAVKGTLSANEIVRDDTLKASEKEHLLRELKNNSLNMKTASDPNVFNRMVEEINNGKITSDDQILSKLGKGLTWSDVNHLRKELNSGEGNQGQQEKIFKKGLDDIAKGMLTKSNAMGFKDPEGDVQLQKWRIFAAQKMQEGREKGLTITQMTDPDSKDYIGKYLTQFKKTPEQIMKSVYSNFNQPTVAPKPENAVKVETPKRLEGESPSSYLERLKKAGKRNPSSVNDLPEGWGKSMVNGKEIITPPSGFVLPRGKEHYDMGNQEDVQNFLNEINSDRAAIENEVNSTDPIFSKPDYGISEEELKDIEKWNKKNR